MRLRHLIIFLLLICCSIGIASAQDAPPGVFEAAVRAANGAKPGLGRADGWKWQRLDPTTLSNLRCSLIQGSELGREVTPYSASLSFSGVTYVVHVSVDGTLSQPCDSKFGALVASTPAPPSGCQLAGAAQPTFRIAPDASTAILGGEVLVNGVAYAIGRTDTREWFQTRNSANQIGWVSIKEVTANGACDPLPITGAQNIDYVTIPCFVTAAQDFSNVRQLASTDGEILTRLYENVYYQVYATTTDGQWVFINPGWVADRVTEKYGDCDSLEVNNSLVGVPPGTPTPFPTATPTVFVSPTPFPTATATIYVSPTVYISPTPRPTATPVTCPGNPAGFLPPRLTVGTANARVISGGDPNRLREEPNVNAVQVGTVQPGRTLDAVLNGPICEGSYVWWLVEVDGVQGWTVESDTSGEAAYYLEPIGVPVSSGPLATTAPIVATATPERIIIAATAAPTSVVIQAPIGDTPGLIASQSLGEPDFVSDVRVLEDGRVLALSGASVQIWRAQDASGVLTSLAADPAALDITATRVFVLDKAGTLHVYALDTLEEISGETISLGQAFTDTSLSMTSDNRYFLTVGCNTTDCTQGKIDLWENQTGKLIRSQPAHSGQPLGAWFTPNDTFILSMGQDGLQIWDTQSGSFVNGVDLTGMSFFTFPPAVTADSALYYLVVCAPSTNAASECGGTTLVGRSLDTNEIVSETPISTFIPTALAISPDHQWFAIAQNDQTIRLWQMSSDGAFVERETYTAGALIISMAFNADGTQLVTGSDAGLAQVWVVPES